MDLNIKQQLYKLYYKYINPLKINHYKLLILTEEYIYITNIYLTKYPTSKGFSNLNKELFILNEQAEIDFYETAEKRSKIENEFFENREIICNSCKNNEFSICSGLFKKQYVERKYHYGQFIRNVVKYLIMDIKIMDKDNVKDNK
jgi:hypothetical protein